MAEVFAGHALGSLGFQKPVAIKRLLPERARDDEFVSRLVAEAKLLVALQHTNVISVLDLVRDGDDVFLVMEFVDGPSLRQLLTVRRAHGQRPLPLGLAAYIVQAACAGLEYAHARKTGAIIHADVSPSNVLLTQAGEVKVADFGIARREGTAAAVEGKWAYMPPEQARGEALTPRSDQFALGVVLYELITGVHPFARRVSEHGRDEGAVDDVRPPRQLRPEIPQQLEAACLRAMAPAPADRYARLQHLHDALAEIRFACGWRDGAPELAAAIQAATGADGVAGVRALEAAGVVAAGALPGLPGRTQLTARPLTLVTKSLLEGTEPSLAGAAAPPGVAVGTDVAARPEGATPHAWSTESVPRVGRRWRPIALGLAAAGAVGAVLAAMIVGAAPAAELPAARPVTTRLAPVAAALAPTVDAVAAVDVVAAVQPDAEPAAEPADADMIELVDDDLAPAAPPPSGPRAARGVRPRPATPRRPVERVAPAPTPVATETGTVRIYATPWAYVQLGGRRYETPTTLTLPAGVHDLTLYNPESKVRKTVTVTVRPGKPKTLTVRLVP